MIKKIVRNKPKSMWYLFLKNQSKVTNWEQLKRLQRIKLWQK